MGSRGKTPLVSHARLEGERVGLGKDKRNLHDIIRNQTGKHLTKGITLPYRSPSFKPG